MILDIITHLVHALLGLGSIFLLTASRETLGKVRDRKLYTALFLVIGAITLHILGSLHEVGHAVVGQAGGFEIELTSTWKGQAIILSPPPLEMPAEAQLATAMAGPLVSGILYTIAWIILPWVRAFHYLRAFVIQALVITGISGIGSMLFPISGDYRNTVQALARLTGISVNFFALVLTLLGIALTILTVRRVLKSIKGE